MADLDDEELKMALKMSMQQESPEPKRSKPEANARDGADESPEIKNRRMQRELLAAAAEKRMMAAKSVEKREKVLDAAAVQVVEKRDKVLDAAQVPVAEKSEKVLDAAPLPVAEKREEVIDAPPVSVMEKRDNVAGKAENLTRKGMSLGDELSLEEANSLFSMVFGSGVTTGILAQWSKQGIRFSPDPETSMGLVQHEGGPCGVLAAIQAFVLKYLLFSPEELSNARSSIQSSRSGNEPIAADNIFCSLTEERKSRALVRSLSEILFLCGSNKRAVIATLSIIGHNNEGSEGSLEDEVIVKALDGLVIESGSDFQKVLRLNSYSTQASACQKLEAMLPVFRSRMGALLFLISALLSRGLDFVQADRDDPSQSLVTAPFGHASQEIVNLLLCGHAVAHVFDGRMDLGGEMFLKGISGSVQVGFLTLLESLNFCKVGQYLKCPKWPIWVVGSESHYTVLFALDTSVQNENELEERESIIRRAFDAQDQSGGGGFVSVEGFNQILKETNINLPFDKHNHLTNSGFIVWSEFLQVLMDLDQSSGGLKDSTGLMGKKVFDLYHFNGIAKSDLNGNSVGGETPTQRPRLTKLRVSVPPRWTPEEFMKDAAAEVSKPEPPQHAPLVDCIRTRWPRATCNWIGDPPSIV